MNNFFDFISNDIEVKKTFLSSLPTKTKTNVKKYNSTIDEYVKKYTSYRESVFNYVKAKKKSLNVPETKKDVDKVNKKIEMLEKGRNLLNPLNTSYEKMGFDGLLYRMSNYYVFNFDSIDNLINEFIDKFALAGINLDSKDFKYNYYVHKYMDVFLNVRAGIKTQDDLNVTFEEIYWVNPDIISHIEINFRKLIKKNMRKFDSYISKIKKEYIKEHNISTYSKCIEELKSAYLEKEKLNDEDVSDIVEKAVNKDFDISQYLESSKFRKSAYTSFLSESVDINDTENMKLICSLLNKLSFNLEEYEGYLSILPIIESFKKDYEEIKDKKNNNSSELKSIQSSIKKEELSLKKINFMISRGNKDKNLKMESINITKKLIDLYRKYDDEFFKSRVLSVLNPNMTVSDVLELFLSFDYFKKLTIQEVYEINDYNEVIKQSNIFDEFAKNPTNLIVKGLPVFERNNIPRIIANKYKLNNLLITEEDITPDNLGTLRNKIDLITRINKINESNTTVEKIWFIVNANKIIEKMKAK